MSFQVSALPAHELAALFSLDDDALRARGARRCVADRSPGFPCRVSLQDAEPGETVILTPFVHQPLDSPYRASGPIFVRQAAAQARPAVGEVPALLRLRTLSVRAYDRDALMVNAVVTDGRELEAALASLLENPDVDYLHVHFAGPGCYACRVDRAQ